MAVRRLDRNVMTLIPDQISMKGDPMLTLFKIVDYRLARETRGVRGVRMDIRLQRIITSELMTTYFPTFLLLLITFATTFFKPFFFEAALSVNLTTMLVMTTIFMNVMQMLPNTAYVKMIDIWLVFCQLVPFTEVVLLTAMEYIREDGEQDKDTASVSQVIHVVGEANIAYGDKKKSYQICSMKTLQTIGTFTIIVSYTLFYRNNGSASDCGCLLCGLLHGCC